MKKISVAAIGFGSWGKRIVEKIHNHSDYKIAGIISKFGEKKDDRFNFYSLSKSADLINSSDLVYISSPPDTHYNYILQSILLKKHILCEKPFCSNLDEIEKILLTTRLNSFDKIFMINYQHTVNFDLLKFIEEIKETWNFNNENLLLEIDCNGPISRDFISRKRDYGSHCISIAKFIIKRLNLQGIKWSDSHQFRNDFVAGSLNWVESTNKQLSVKVSIGDRNFIWSDDDVKFDSIEYLLDIISTSLLLDKKYGIYELNNLKDAKYIEKVLQLKDR